MISGVNLETLVTSFSVWTSYLWNSLCLFLTVLFFSCTYQLSLLLLFRLCHLAKYWNRKVYLLQRIWKKKKKRMKERKDMSFSVLFCSLLFLRSERQNCSSCYRASSSHFLLEVALFCLCSGHCWEGLCLACSFWTTAVCFALCHICLEFDQMTLWMSDGRNSLQGNFK